MTISKEQFEQLDASFEANPSKGTEAEEVYLLRLAYKILVRQQFFYPRPSIFHSYATAHVKSNPDAHLVIRCLDILNNPPVSSRDCPSTTNIADTLEFKLSILEYDIGNYLEARGEL